MARSLMISGPCSANFLTTRANLPDEAYEDIGRGVRAIARGYRDAFEASKTAPKK
jgi:hypothetical protein